MTHRALAQEGPDLHPGHISVSPLAAGGRRHEETCSITSERGTTLALGAALPLAGFAPSTTGRFSGVHRGNIESRPLWKPMHLQPVLAGAPAYLGGCPEALFARGLCLPSGTGMSEADLERVAGCILPRWTPKTGQSWTPENRPVR